MSRFNFASLRLVFCLVCLSSLLTESTSAQTYYVSNSGDNSRSKIVAQDPATPWRSIQVAVNRARPGSTIVVENGTYWENVDIYRGDLTIRARNKQGAKLIGSIYGFDVSRVTISGLEIVNRRPDNFRSKGISFSRCHNITIRDNRVHNCRGGGIGLDQCDYLLVEWNIVHHNAFFNVGQHSGISIYQPQVQTENSGSAFGVIVRNNTSFANENLLDNPLFGRPTDGNGIVIDDTQNLTSPTGNGQTYPRKILVENNLCYFNGGQGVHCYQSNNVFIRNNTLYQNMKSFDFGGEVSAVRSFDVRVYNNILVARRGRLAALEFESPGGVWWDYNLVHNGDSRDVFHGFNTIFAAPAFQPGGAFRLHSYSPAVDNGLTHSRLFDFDIEGGLRSYGDQTDIGANEYTPFD